MLNSPTPNSKFIEKLNDPNTSLEDVIASTKFTQLWLKSDSHLINFLKKHFDEIIEIGFQTKNKSINSIRCLQIISTTNSNFRHFILNETNLLQFVYDFLFHMSSYENYSQTNYFYVLPNIMIEKLFDLNSKFDDKYFIELFQHIDNDYAFNFILRLFEFAPRSVFTILKDIQIDEMIVSNLIKYNTVETQSKNLLIRNQILFTELFESKYEGDISMVIYKKIGKIIQNAIQNPNVESISFLLYLDKIAAKRTTLSKWHRVHVKLIPCLPNFCNIILEQNNQTFTPLCEKCTLLTISIVSSTKDVPDVFISLFKHLLQLFFVLKTNTFLHNCVVKMFKAMKSIGKLNSEFLDELDLFTKITECYMNRSKNGYSPNWGQLKQISDEMNQFVENSKTVDIEKWKKFVMKKNANTELIMKQNLGGYIPPDINEIKRYFLKHKYYNPSFISKNLMNENKQPKKFLITSPLY